jgi:hypothetical protein
MEAGGRQTKRAERPAPVGRAERLRRVFDEHQLSIGGDGGELVHLARDTGVVDRDDRSRVSGDRRADQRLVDREGLRMHVDEHRHRAAQDEGVGRRHEGERRHDHFVARLHLGEQRTHLQGRRSRMGQQRLAAAGAPLQPFVALAGEETVAGQVRARDRLADVVELASGDVRPVER